MLVAAMDSAVVAQCSRERFHCLDWSRTEVSQDRTYNRGDFSGFRALGVRKVDALLSILRAGALIEYERRPEARPVDLASERRSDP